MNEDTFEAILTISPFQTLFQTSFEKEYLKLPPQARHLSANG